MNWIKHTENNKELLNLPRGTILKVQENPEYGSNDKTIYTRVLGDGRIINNKCDQNDSAWLYTEADWTSLDCSYIVLEYALPPKEYMDFLNEKK